MANWYSRPNTVEMAGGTEKTEYHLCFETFDKDEAKRIEETFKAIMDGEDINVPIKVDTISRQAAIDAVDAIGHIATMPDGDKCIRRSAVKYTLSMLPSAQPERKTGRWIETEGLDEEIRCLMCTNHMRSDLGCDGACQYNEHVYKKIMSALERRMIKVEHE